MAGRGFPRANRVQTSIWDTRITDANQTTGDNFFGAVGGPADLFLIRDINGERQLEAIQTNGTATVFDTSIPTRLSSARAISMATGYSTSSSTLIIRPE